MSTPTVDELVSDYLARLEAATGDLPAARRTELLEEIREHIAEAREAGGATDEAAVRTMLDRLGEPEDIAAAARAEHAEREPPAVAGPGSDAVPPRPGTGLEVGALLLLTIGSIVPVAGWAAGVVLLWASQRWRAWEKVLGTLVVPGGPGLFFWAGTLFATRTCTGTATRIPASSTILENRTCTVAGLPPWLGVSLFVTALVAPFVVAALLYSRARARAAAESAVREPATAMQSPGPGRAEPPGRSPWGGSEIASVVLLGASSVVALVMNIPFGVLPAAVLLLLGLTFLWTSPQWTQREKWIATAIAAGPAAAALLVVVALTMVWRVV